MKIKKRTRKIAPSLWRWPLEARALLWIPFDTLMIPFLGALYQLFNKSSNNVIIVIPGFCANDKFTEILRKFLTALGNTVNGWGYGFNLGGTIEELEEKLTSRLEEVYHESGQRKVVLVGWSLGGIYARWLAHVKPEYIKSIVTLGSPFNKTSTGTNVSWLFKKVTGQNPNNYTELLNIIRRTPPVPTTSIFSKADGVVATECCFQADTAKSESICVPYVSHLGMVTNPMIFRIIADRLTNTQENWAPYKETAKYNFRTSKLMKNVC